MAKVTEPKPLQNADKIRAEIIVSFAEIPGNTYQAGDFALLTQDEFERYSKAKFVKRAK